MGKYSVAEVCGLFFTRPLGAFFRAGESKIKIFSPVDGKLAGTQYSTPLWGISASKVSLRSLSAGVFRG